MVRDAALPPAPQDLESLSPDELRQVIRDMQARQADLERQLETTQSSRSAESASKILSLEELTLAVDQGKESPHVSLTLADVLDRSALQAMMEDFFRITEVGIGVIDLRGEVLVGVGWQDICTKFHRLHPECRKNCIESDVLLSQGVPAGTFRACHCKNHLWDLVTPIEVGGQHLGNVFLGQFFFSDEIPDREIFRDQARRFGFDETEYLAALDRVPRWSREKVNAVMSFYTKLAGMISSLGFTSVNLSRVLAQKEAILVLLQESKERLFAILSSIYAGLLVTSEDGRVEFVNRSFCDLVGLPDSPETLRGMTASEILQKAATISHSPAVAKACISKSQAQEQPIIGEEVALPRGRIGLCDFIPISISGGNRGALWQVRDISGLKQAEEEAKRSEEALKRQIGLFSALLKNLPVGVFMVEAPTGKPLLANDAACLLMGRGILPDVSRQNLSQVYKAFKLENGDPYPLDEMPVLLGMSGKSAHVDNMIVERPDGTQCLLEVFGSPVLNDQGKVWASLACFLDITRRRQDEQKIRRNEMRLRGLVSILQYRAQTVQEFLDMALHEVVKLTESSIGYIFFYREDSRQFVLNAWSREAMRECAVAHPQREFRLEETGLWGEVVRQRKSIILNDFSADCPLKKGFPEGHVALTRFMTVPVFRDDEIVAVVGVANKDSAYDDDDELQLTLLMDAVWKSVDIMAGAEALRESEERHRTILQTAMDGFLIADMEGRLLEVNETYSQMSGYDPQELLRMRIQDLDVATLVEPFADHVNVLLEQGKNRFESQHRRKDGSLFDVEMSVQRRPDGGGRLVAFLRDITDRKRAEEQKARLESQLQQSQKMESVGRLAGGVAHDFNNMLSVILGHAELALEAMEPGQRLHASLVEISRAGRRSAELTKQLLAFARKQTVVPKILDLNETVAGMLAMLERLIGENIHLTWRPGANLWAVLVDPSQIDQILANLCVNARDAITDTGRIIIETRNVHLDDIWCAGCAGCPPGDFVQMTVSDSGCGMTKETMSHLFEPFFTTKGTGKGTGLGLATVYGVVSQNRGFLKVYSEPGQGTTFTIHLPRHVEANSQQPPEEQPVANLEGNETILLVEDEPAILELTAIILRKHGYTVLSAAMPTEAICLAAAYPGRIDLLMTDVIMPEMNGRDLAEQLRNRYPGLKRLFMSGYPADVIAHHSVLDDGVCFIQKPFSMSCLAAKIREALQKND